MFTGVYEECSSESAQRNTSESQYETEDGLYEVMFLKERAKLEPSMGRKILNGLLSLVIIALFDC